MFAGPDRATIIPSTARDLSADIIDSAGRVRLMPASFYRDTTQDDRSLTCVLNGLYCLPTIELVDWLNEVIGPKPALEIGSGNGVLAAALGIRATDNHMQEWPEIAAFYRSIRQTPVRYGPNVENIDAVAAVKKYRPEVVVAAWVTHKFDAARPEARGNEFGVDEEEILANCKSYVFIGNQSVHAGKSIWSRPHDILRPDWLYSRSAGTNFIAIWNGDR